jgi:hypothetical protein
VRDVHVKIASVRAEWKQAFVLAAASYRAGSFQSVNNKTLRFTPYHALPDTVTFVAKHEDAVIATLSLVFDNTLLGLPMASIYGDKIDRLRAAGRHVVEVTSLADAGLSTHEFVPIFVSLMDLMTQYALSQEADALVMSVHPRHENFYRKVLGLLPLGLCRTYAAGQDHPAECYLLDEALRRANAPHMHQTMHGQRLPPQALVPVRMPRHLAQYFGSQSTPECSRQLREIFECLDACGNPRRW